MEILESATTWLINLPIFSEPKYLIAIFGVMAYFIYVKFFGNKQFCFVRIKEKRGDVFVDHGKIYKAFVRKTVSSSGRIIKWLYISGIKKVWRIPQNTEFTPSAKSKILELAWFGKNTFQVVKLDEYMYEKKEGEKGYHKRKTTEANMRVVPEDLKYMDYELSTKIDNLTSNKSWLQDWLDKHGAVFIVMLFCFLMVFITVNKISVQMDESRESFDSMGAIFTDMVREQTIDKVDDNTVKGQDISKIGSTNKNGGTT